MRLLVMILALLLTLGGLYLAMAGGNSALDYFTRLSDSQQRMLSSGMTVFSVLVLAVGAFLRRRRAGSDEGA